MLKKLIKSILKQSFSKKHHYHSYSSSDAWKRGRHHRGYSHMGHHHYKRKHRSGSFMSSFFSS